VWQVTGSERQGIVCTLPGVGHVYTATVMRKKDTVDVLQSTAAVVMDALAVFGGFALATWLRFGSGWIPRIHNPPQDLYEKYLTAALAGIPLFLLIFKVLGLYVRPQVGSFVNKIPRIVRAVGVGVLLSAVLAFSAQNEVDIARLVVALSFVTITLLVVMERAVMVRLEKSWSSRSGSMHVVLILGTDAVAAHVQRTLMKEPTMRSRITGFLETGSDAPDEGVPADQVLGTVEDLESILENQHVDRLIITDGSLDRVRIVNILLLCERHLVEFNMVPDLFRIMTTSMDVQSLNDIPLLGIGRWPLDVFWNRVVKRAEDIVGGVVGLILSAPILAVAAAFIKASSPGPVFYSQERCGERGNTFIIYKLRTMRTDAETQSGPVFASREDSRTTRVGAFLRRYNLDELPQFWNVLAGHMSLVGPRPERPHFVETFKDDVSRYMQRHVSKPGLTGWAQVNGLRGNSSIEERVKYDLYYLENWSLAFDFKILAMTFFAGENAY